jgi:Uma2 family endonuclease
MSAPAVELKLSYEDYLALERSSGLRHEWLDGRVYAMAGGTLAHGALAVAVLAELRALALPCGCVAYSSDAKVRIEETGLSTYPDGAVVCGRVEVSPRDRHAMTNPTVIVEVLSDSTEAYDRGEKWAHYRRLASLRDYVLVSQHTARIELYSREGDHWTLREAGPGESLALTGLTGVLSVDRVYAGITLDPPPPTPT